jgi:FixJ family two-component response regulator
MYADKTVFIVEDDDAVRDSLCELVKSVALAPQAHASGQAFLNAYRPGQRGCLVADMRLPLMSGLQLQQKMKEAGIHLPVIFVTAHADVDTAVRAMKAGAFDFMQKSVNSQFLLDRIHQALAHDAKYYDKCQWCQEARARAAHLTEREREIFEYLSRGANNAEISQNLGIGSRTVETHRAKLMVKMQADSLAELIRMAVACELL